MLDGGDSLSGEALHPTAPRIAVVAIVLSFALAAGVGILRTVNGEPVERSAEVAGNLAFTVVFAVPASLALLGLRRRPSLLVGAGLLEFVFAFLTLISIGLIFVVPGVMFLLSAGRVQATGTRPVASIAAVILAVVLGTGAFFALFARDDPICWATNATAGESVRLDATRFFDGSSGSMGLPRGTSESGCSSDFISNGEALLATAVVAAMLGSVWAVSSGDGDRPSPQVDSRPEHGGVAQR